jgi:O-antigen/teichoic acid export membrane protein
MQLIALRFRKYLENTFWLILEKGFSLIAGVVVGIYVARYLRPESFGLLNYAISFVGIFSVFSTLGLDQIMVRELSRQPSRRNELLGTAFILRALGSAFLMATMCGVLMFMGNDSLTNTLILIIAAAEILKGFEVISYFYQSQVQSKHAVHIQLAVNLMVSLIKLVMVILQAHLIWFAIMVAVGSLLNAAGFIWTYEVRTGALKNWVFRKALAFDLLKESWPLIFYGLALHTQARIDQVMLGNMLNNHEVGQYTVALKFIEVFGFVPMVLMSTFTPAVSKAKITDDGLYHSRLLNLYRLMFLAFLVVAGPVYFFSETVIVVLYGAEYQPAGYLLSLFALRLFFSNMGVGKSVFVMNEGLFKYSLLTVVLGAIANIGLNYVLIPLYGPVGSVVASMLSFTVSIFLVDLFFRKARQNQRLMIRGMLSFWKWNNVQ